eukprot:6196257-Pleurochrysis_carterae.AAC.3
MPRPRADYRGFAISRPHLHWMSIHVSMPRGSGAGSCVANSAFCGSALPVRARVPGACPSSARA